MSDLTDPYDSTVVRPSIPRDHLAMEDTEMAKVTRQIKSNDSILDAAAYHMDEAAKAKKESEAAKQERDHWQGIAYQLGTQLVLAELARWPIKIDTFLVDMGYRATDKTVGHFYEVSVKPGKAGS